MTQITSGQLFGDENPAMRAMNEFVAVSIKQMNDWFLEGELVVDFTRFISLGFGIVADVPNAETQYKAHEFLDVTVQPKPIYISPNEVYSMHSLLLKHLDVLAPHRDDPLRAILHELDGVPNLRSAANAEELHDARDRAITLELTNRFAVVKG